MIRYEVRYQTPYNACEWRSQWFRTYDEILEFSRWEDDVLIAA